MRISVGIIGALLVALMLAEFFVTFLLPRRVKRDPRFARRVLRFGWNGWRRAARRLSTAAADTMLGIYGPLSLIGMLALWTLGLVVGFAMMQWATGSHLSSAGSVSFGDDLFFSGGGFLSASTNLTPVNGVARGLFLLEAACGFGVLFIAIGYLPALFQAFSRREVAVSQLDARAGSPPTAGALLERSGQRGGWASLDAYLGEWETWSAELMETHLSYPILAYFRSQHLNQNWLSALTTILDASAFTLAATPSRGAAEAAEVTFAIGRHALADLAFMFNAEPLPPDPERLGHEGFAQLFALAQDSGLELRDEDEVRARLHEIRAKYEPYAAALARWLELRLPEWLPSPEAEANWRRSAWRPGRVQALP
ncbi:MAG: two pore domain potassium channel family protein [Candidatus Rokuibacteriota bacterium]|nr:MAG: two pore domain potassium channel family protein [Candidatus Rokubacteria bacterium]